MIDPNIWASEDMAKLTHRQRLLVIGLFSNADDHGKGIAKPAYIRSTVFPYDDIPINEIIDDLETIRAVISMRFYEVKGNSYYLFDNWSKWQTVQKPQPSIIPDLVENDSVPIPEPFSPKGKEEKGKEEGKEEKGREGAINPSDILNNPHEAKVTKWLKENEVVLNDHLKTRTFFSYIGAVDIELIEAAIVKSKGRKIAYCLGTLEGMISDGVTKEFLRPKVGESNEKPQGSIRHESSPPEDKPIAPDKVGWLGNGKYKQQYDGKVVQMPNLSG